MSFIIGLLTFVILLDCMVLILLILMQLPKKEAGAGIAFGGAATDALFGAGSGNFLTKATKYAAIIFFALALILSVLQIRFYHRSGIDLRRALQQTQQEQPAAPMPGAEPAGPAAGTPLPAPGPAPLTNTLQSAPLTVETNAPPASTP